MTPRDDRAAHQQRSEAAPGGAYHLIAAYD